MGIEIEVHQRDDRQGDIITLKEPLSATFRGKSFVVHPGFESDGVSVPRVFWSLVSPQIDPRSLRAGIAHDYIYRVQPEGWTRAEADAMFRQFLVEDGLGSVRAFLAYAGVRIGGGVAWRDNAELLKKA